MSGNLARGGVVAALVLLGALSWWMREVEHRRLTLVGNAGWVTTDPDTLYHARRVERALAEGRVAGSDAYLDHPHGSPIPWPPYYTRLVAWALAPFAPEDPALRRPWVEMRVASAGRVFGVLTTLLAAAAGWGAAGGVGACLAGGYHAVCAASIAYSKSGNGDHHAFVGLLLGLVLVVLGRGFGEQALARRAAGWRTGCLAGALTGLLLGAWVGALAYVVVVDLALAWLLFVNARRPLAGLAPLGLGFHAAALVVLLPAAAASPWRSVDPWMLINLTWFQPAFLAAGALVFAPLFALNRAGAAWRCYPWIVGGSLALAGAALLLGGRAGGLGEAFAWAARTDAFMERVDESRPLVGSGRYGELFEFVGFGALLLPPAWALVARGAWRGRLELVPWAVAVPLLALQAARQGRFADALVLPLGVTLAHAARELLERARPPARGVARGAPAAALALLLALSLNLHSVGKALRSSCARMAASGHRGLLQALGEAGLGLLGPAESAVQRERPAQLGARGAADWLRLERGRGAGGDSRGVLALWSYGHVIEWAADRPSVATNFGSYVGPESMADPCRFFVAEDPAAARALLERREVGWVLVTSDLPNSINLMIEQAAPERRDEYAGPPDARGVHSARPAWFRTLGARLLFDGDVVYPMGAPADAPPVRPLDFLRLLYVAPQSDPGRRLRTPTDVSPAAWLWELVPGAEIEARGEPGERLEVSIPVRYPKAKRQVTWSAGAPVGPDGLARLRVPYATVDPNGDGWVSPGTARWRLGPAGGELLLGDADVTGGRRVELAR
jgi:asparagine N-glycosylation enzyme membrane subunit Stt3